MGLCLLISLSQTFLLCQMRILGSVSPKAVVDIQQQCPSVDSKCMIRVGVCIWASENMVMQFSHSPHMSSYQHSTNRYQVAPGMICSLLLGIQAETPVSRDRWGWERWGGVRMLFHSTPPMLPLYWMPTSPQTCHLQPLFPGLPVLMFSPAWQLMFSNVLVWALLL